MADDEKLKQRNAYDKVMHERDILGTQLIRRNDELALLYEKIAIQNSTLEKGSVQYRFFFHYFLPPLLFISVFFFP